MKTLIASVFALTLMSAAAANAEGVGAGVHIGNVGVGVHVGDSHRDSRYHRPHRRCISWGHSRDHGRYCRHWSR